MSEQALDMKQKDVPAEKTEGNVSEEREATVDEILKKDTSKAQVLLKKRFRIYSTRPLPELDMPNAKAYVAEDLQALGRKVYALVIPPQMPLRVDNLKEMTSIKSVGLLEFLDSGTIFWPLFSVRRTKHFKQHTGAIFRNRVDEFSRFDASCHSSDEYVLSGRRKRTYRVGRQYHLSSGI